ncbi:MAG: hypothetical protein ABMB14_00930 [Myxococcota bacterium]
MITAALSLLSLTVGCRTPAEIPLVPGPSSFTAIATAHGRTVQTGSIVYGDYDDCCESDSSCFFSNASSPYGVYDVPPAPGQPIDDPDIQPHTPSFHLRPDEALVFLGTTPPPAAYFGWRSYLAWRLEDEGPRPILGSLGPSLNNQVVAAARAPDPVWGAPFALVTTADAAVEREIVGWLVESGWDPRWISVDRIPASLVRLGFDRDADTFAGVMRVAVFDDPAAGAAYTENPGVVLRVTPGGAVPAAPAEPHPVAAVPPRGSGETEQAWQPAVDALGDAIRARYPDHLPIEVDANPWWFETYDCIDDGFCSFDITDRYYARVPSLYLPTDDTFVIAYGVNHERTGKASYANVTIESVANMTGLAGVDSPQFPGSARTVLPDEPKVDDLYLVVIARDCTQFPGFACLEVPTGCPGVDLDEELIVDFRAYLEPATNAAPLHEELIADRVIKFFPKPN